MKQTKTSLKKKADILFSQHIRSLGYCEKCGKTSNLQCAHIISRSVIHLRYEPKNALCLCAGCHLYWAHKEPLAFSEFVYTHKGKDTWHWLLEESKKIQPVKISFYLNIIEQLKQLKAA
ncbi:MAG: hypothetical protein ACM3UK_00075 [Actinomycetes bacterium]